MSNIFSQWQNKEISDIECIRGLNNQNRELIELIKDIEPYVPYSVNKLKDLIRIKLEQHHTSEEGK